MANLSLLTDLYQLTMLGGYHQTGKLQQRTCFDLYFRRLPFKGGFCIAAGLELALEYLESLRFETEDIDYLHSLKLFPDDFLDWLKQFRFRGDIQAMPEGEIVFPNEPLLRVEADLGEAQLVESALLNMVNFQTLVATKAARVCLAAEDGIVLEFGLRRAQGVNGALAASRASFVGGCHATSNALAGQRYGIPVQGTHAHSWIMSFDRELDAFRAYAQVYPDSCTLLVDTYDTLTSGVPNAVIVGRELAESGHRLSGIRLDSGDLAELSKKSRALLDQGGLEDAKIVASNDLDEHEIKRLKAAGARIDIWGVGTNLATCKDEPALGGVYKLAAVGEPYEPKLKVSANPIKTTIPGVKQVYRFYDSSDRPTSDLICLENETPDPQGTVSLSPNGGDTRQLRGETVRPLLLEVMKNGVRVCKAENLPALRQRTLANLATLPDSFKQLTSSESYFVGLSQPLFQLREKMIGDVQSSKESAAPLHKPDQQ